MHFLQRAIIFCLYGLKHPLSNLVGLSAAVFNGGAWAAFPNSGWNPSPRCSSVVNVIFTNISAELQDSDLHLLQIEASEIFVL